MRYLFTALICSISSPLAAFSEPDRLSFLLGSHHVGIQIEVEEVNPGLFLEWTISDPPAWLDQLRPNHGRKPTFVTGAFRNSFGDGALAAAITVPLLGESQIEFDAIVGGAWYPGNGDRVAISLGDLVPLAGLRLSYGHVFVLAFPGDGESFDGLFAAGVSLPFGNQN